MDQNAGPPRQQGRASLDGADGSSLVTRLEDVATLAFHGVPGCDDAAVTVVLDDGVVTVGATSAGASDVETVQHQHGSGPGLTALRQGRVVAVDDYQVDARWPHVARAAGAHGVRSTLCLPLLHKNAVLGALNLHGRQPGAFGTWAGHVGGVLARQAVGAIAEEERGRRTGAQLDVQRRIARTLQHDLAPALPRLPGVLTAGRYVAAEGSVEVGGDWFDVFPVPHQAIGLVIGDVMGHGIDAAYGMSQLRTALRICAHDSSSPADVLDRLDRLMQFFDLSLTTAVYGTLALQPGGAELVYCNAGHPPPLVRWPDGRVSRLDGGSSWLLGGPTAQLGWRGNAAVRLPSGAVLVLYTDGLVERRGRHLDVGIDMLRDALAAAGPVGAPELLCSRLIDAVCEPGCSDDLALLVIQIC